MKCDNEDMACSLNNICLMTVVRFPVGARISVFVTLYWQALDLTLLLMSKVLR